jgi:hypothetical protein
MLCDGFDREDKSSLSLKSVPLARRSAVDGSHIPLSRNLAPDRTVELSRGLPEAARYGNSALSS